MRSGRSPGCLAYLSEVQHPGRQDQVAVLELPRKRNYIRDYKTTLANRLVRPRRDTYGRWCPGPGRSPVPRVRRRTAASASVTACGTSSRGYALVSERRRERQGGAVRTDVRAVCQSCGLDERRNWETKEYKPMARPKKLQTVVQEHTINSILSTTREVLADVVRSKLREQNVDVARFPVDKFVEYMLSNKEEEFVWQQDEHDGAGRKTVSLEFTDKEARELSSQVDDLVESTGSILQENLEAFENSILRRMEENWPEQRSREDTELYGFRNRLELRWGVPLNLFRMMLTISRELFDGEVESLSKSRAKSGRILREALLGIHARALRTATAVLVLLENGLADDAYARWRTLYELSVMAAFLSERGEKVAERYLAHEAVTLKKRLDNELSWGKVIPKGQQQEIERNYDAVVAAYGKPFKNHYGWAACFIDGNDNPRFVDIEQAIKGKMIAPPYKESSLQVHGGRDGLLGLSSSYDVMAISHSNLGLDIPLMHSSLCLMQVTSLHLYHSPSRDVVLLGVLVQLEKKIDKQCRKVAKELAKDEAVIRKEGR